jgi:hypothetical protein
VRDADRAFAAALRSQAVRPAGVRLSLYDFGAALQLDSRFLHVVVADAQVAKDLTGSRRNRQRSQDGNQFDHGSSPSLKPSNKSRS